MSIRFTLRLLFGSALLCLPFYSFAATAADLEQHSCHLKGLSSPVTCGTLTAPLDHRSPQGEQLALKFAVLPALKRNAQPDPLVFLAGGPGQSALSVASQVAMSFADVRRSRDIVLLDQRGTGQSFALNCHQATQSQGLDPLLGIETIAPADITACLAELEQQGAELAHFSTESHIRDLELLRQALGYPKVNLYGGSYGSRAAMSYLRFYPQALRSVVIDAVAPVTVPIGAFGQSAARAFELMLAACEQDSACHDAFPKLRQEFRTLLSTLEQQPLSQPIFHPRTGQPVDFELDKLKLVNLLRLSLYHPQSRGLMPLMIHQAASGNLQPLLGLALQGAGSLELAHGLHLNIVCSEDFHRVSQAELRHDADNSFGGDSSHSLYRTACPLWPSYTPPDELYQPLTAPASGVPTLLLSGNYDPVTPPANAERLLDSLTNARHLVAEHGAHTIAFHTCADTLISEFLAQPAPEALDASCLAQQPPVAFALDINASYGVGTAQAEQAELAETAKSTAGN